MPVTKEIILKLFGVKELPILDEIKETTVRIPNDPAITNKLEITT